MLKTSKKHFCNLKLLEFSSNIDDVKNSFLFTELLYYIVFLKIRLTSVSPIDVVLAGNNEEVEKKLFLFL